MSAVIDHLQAAMQQAIASRPAMGGFPDPADALRRAGVTRNVWQLPSCQSLYLTNQGPVVMQGEPLVIGAADVPSFDQAALVTALRTDQAGNSTFREFQAASWRAGIVRYDVDFEKRTVTYYGCNNEEYVEAYPAI